MSIPTLDLFSGIGGYAIALQRCCRQVGYCDIDPFARSVLEARFADGRLRRAPVFEDVGTLDVSRLRTKPKMVTASFPCQDISAAGKRDGLKGERSKLFWEIMRIVDDAGPDAVDVVLMENSPDLYVRGLDGVLAALHKRGFRCVYGKFAASDVGARHKRLRWYCLAVRRDGKGSLQCLKKLTKAGDAFAHDFAALERAVPRLALKLDRAGARTQLSRASALGNSVLPQVVTLACRVLATAALKDHAAVAAKAAKTGSKAAKGGKGNDHVDLGWDWEAIEPKRTREYPQLRLPIHGEPKRLWPTPIHMHPRPTLEAGGSGDHQGTRSLASRVFHEASTRTRFGYARTAPDGSKAHRDEIDAARKKYVVNPVWVEVLMGYPKEWTRP